SVNDLFTIQREIAVAIAGMLQRTLSPAEESSLAEAPTRNMEAYQAYLKGRHISHSDHFVGEAALKAVEHLNDAVALDSTFALAYAELARCHARAYYLRTDLTEERRAMADAAAETALALDPVMPEVHLAVGDYINWAYRDKQRAMQHWSIAEQGMPNNAEVIGSKAYVLFMEGRIDECIADYTRVTKLSPQNTNGFENLAWANMWAHDFPASIEAADRAIELAPETNWPYLYRGMGFFFSSGPCQQSYAAYDAVDHAYSWYFWVMWLSDMAEGRYDAAMERVKALPDGWDDRKTDTYPAELHEAWILQVKGGVELASRKYKEAAQRLEKALIEHAGDARFHSALGMALAGAGETERGIAMALKATEILPYEKEACYGISPMYDLAATYAIAGDMDKAFEHVEECLTSPGYFTVEYLKADPRYASMRNDPRWQELLRKYAVAAMPA
ncbi:MAG: hypothetical protein KDC03_23415, partial [Flavobacteriales bacterium]|nr:hypothetical protein [Flavobacteriales bacterium]